jgi:DivIVA domain-containing protein
MTNTTTNDYEQKGEVMPLTPEDVSNKRFTPVRLREGYDMGEVDQFLDEVEAELARLTRENDDLRAKLSAAQSGAVDSASAPMAQEPPAPEPVPEVPTGFAVLEPAAVLVTVERWPVEGRVAEWMVEFWPGVPDGLPEAVPAVERGIEWVVLRWVVVRFVAIEVGEVGGVVVVLLVGTVWSGAVMGKRGV